MKKHATSTAAFASGVELDALVLAAWEGVGASFERFCVMAGITRLQQMLSEDAERLAGGRHERSPDRPGYRWGSTAPPARLAFTAAGWRWNVRGCGTRRRGDAAGTFSAELGGCPQRGLSGRMGDELDAVECLDPEERSCGAASRGVGPDGLRAVEVGGIASVQGVDRGEVCRMDVIGSVGPRSCGDPDRRASPCR